MVFMPRAVRYLFIPVVLLVLLCTRALPALQTPPPADPPTQDAPASDDAGTASASAGQPGEIKVEVEKFGVGKIARPGEWTGFRLRVLDTSSKPREVLVRLSVRDPDGDFAVAQRDITTNPNTWQGVWLYQRLPFSFRAGDPLTVACFEAVEVKDSAGKVRFEAGRRLGDVRITPQTLVESCDGMIAVVGTRTAGLNNYGVTLASGTTPALSHEISHITVLSAPNELPDRWMGLMQFETVVWTAGDPAELRGERAAALREWVKRGGHLVIVLPPVGQTWTSSANNELYDMLPAVTFSRRENVDLAPFRSMLTHSTRIRLPRNTVLHTFTPVKDAAPSEAMQILKTPASSGSSECVVARRLVGTGAVSLVGFDLNNRELADMAAIDADILWNRILGKRGIFPSPSELTEMAKPTLNSGGPVSERTNISVDHDIPALINHTATAGTGVLLGILAFGTYWLLAGPLGFYILKQKTKTHYAWLAFIGTGIVFTALTWTGAALLRPGKTEATHLTILDHVYGQPTQRARSWMQVLIPRYGDANLVVGDPADKDPQHAIAAWEPRTTGSNATAFTDTRDYIAEWRTPSTLTVPVRATIKQVQIDWASGPRLKMPIPVKPEGSTSDEPPSLKLQKIKRGSVEREAVVGILKHELPAALTDVRIIVVRHQQPMSGQSSDALPVDANVYGLTGPWLPGAPLDLEIVTSEASRDSLATKVLSDLMPPTKGTLQTLGAVQEEKPNADLAPRHLLATTLYGMLEPPPRDQMSASIMAFRRYHTHGYDISRWFSQPCVIILGHLGEGIGKDSQPSPVPLTLDGEALSTRGMTLIRWIYPLADAPPDVSPARALEDSAAPPAAQPTPQGKK